MAQHKTKAQYLKDSLKVIEKYKLFFVTDIAPLIGISVARFYQLELEKVEEIKQALLTNRIEVKSSMRNKWYNSDNATLQMGLYKLIGTEEEYHRLANTKIDITSREEQPIFKGLELKGLEDEENAPESSNETKNED